MKARGNFKERLRELGGLDAIFEVVISCYSTMEVSITVLLFLYCYAI